jgi:chemotaxis protein MotB
LLLASAACVPTGKYDAAVANATQAKAALAKAEQASKAASVRFEQDVQAARDEARACQVALDDMTAVNQELRAELLKSGKDADQLLAAKGELATSLEQAKARLDELRRAQAAAEARSALFRDLSLKLKRMIDAGDLQVTLRSGRMVLVLPTDVLFDSGKAEVKPRGRETLSQLAAALSGIRGRRFQVAGHTDDEPIRFSGYGSNWELSSARALEVVSLLVQGGMQAGALSAAGYAEFDPVAGNDTAEGKARNRRIEITLQPNIDELVAVPEPRG